MKLSLPHVTLICADCVETTFSHAHPYQVTSLQQSINVLNRCQDLCDFGEVKLLTSLTTDYPFKVEIPHLPSLVHYSIFMLKRLYEYVFTSHVLVVQGDGWILNPQAWDHTWNDLDYIGPLFNQYDVMGVGGFSYRSRALMEEVSKMYPHWDGTNTDHIQKIIGQYEDGAIAMGSRAKLTQLGFKYATLEQGAKFAQGGNPNNKYYYSHPFGFHGSWRTIDVSTGTVGDTIKHDGFVPQPV